jgi:hypothetical protein
LKDERRLILKFNLWLLCTPVPLAPSRPHFLIYLDEDRMVLLGAPPAPTPTFDLREEKAGSASEDEDEQVHIELEGYKEKEENEEDDSGEERATKKAHLSRDDYIIIVRWMEVSENYKATNGTGEKTKVGGNLMKSDGFELL